MSDKSAATFHPRPCPANQCMWCGKTYGTDGVNAGHEPKCDMRVEGK